MSDIARLAGVSQSCVSLVLNEVEGARLSDATRERVRAAAASIGYKLQERRDSQHAAGASNRRGVIAYIVDEISISPHPVLHVDGARDAAWQAGLMLQTYVTRSNKDLEAEVLATIGHNPDLIGVIYAASYTREADLPAGLGQHPVVLLNCYTSEKRFPTILPGEVAGGFSATEHLIAHGHRRIGHIGGEPWMDAARDRQKGYREALATHDIAFDPALVEDGDWTLTTGYELGLRLLKLPNRPTAIFCANDVMAIGCANAARDLDLAIPADLSLIGYNDIELSRHTRPPLSSCRVPNYDMGQRAVDLLVDMALHARPPRSLLIKMECSVIGRGSVQELETAG
ncbi:LacI family transcriptional regulator [Bosea sp. BK604]|nr:LacI family transcriptional regulator [Bosea sp. BK604]